MVGDERQLAQLPAGQHAIRNGDPQHRGQTLDVEAILKSQRQEFCWCQFSAQEAGGLVSELGDPVSEHLVVIVVVSIHGE